MQYPLFYLLGASLIPELGSDISAGTSCHIHLILICVAAIGTFPDELAVGIRNNLNLSVIITLLSIIALGV